MSGRMLSSLVVFCIVAAMIAFISWPRAYKASASGSSSAASVATSSREIQSKAVVFDLSDPNGSTSVGIMAAYEPAPHAFWWRPTPFIAEPGMLERFFERCKFVMDGNALLNICVRGNEVVVTTTADSAQGLDQGLANAQSQLQNTPGLLMAYRGPRDHSFNLQQRAGVDMNTAEGVPPTVVRSVRRTAAGWDLDVTCGCGDALISVNNNFDFVALRRD